MKIYQTKFDKSQSKYTMIQLNKIQLNSKFKIPKITWDEEFELADGSYFVLDIQNYFEYIIKNRETLTDRSPIQIMSTKSTRVTFKTNTRYLDLLLTPGTTGHMKLLQSTERKITKEKNAENVSQLEITEVALVHCDINQFQIHSFVRSFVPDKSFSN